ncbi:MAG: hypothetical protein JWO05_2383 [Gemmatimonadetes bacterium]|nr:hypothetical protein [Gemmatimonadota bacterium]
MPLLISLLAAGAVRLASADSAISITPGFSSSEFVAALAPIELTPSRWPDAAEGRLAVIVGSSDLSALFVRNGGRLVFQSPGIALPSGESEVKAFLVSGAEWREIGRFPIHVLTPLGFEKAQLDPSLELTNTGQLAEDHTGSALAPARSTWQNWGGTAGVQTDHLRQGWTVQSQLHFIGAGRRAEALRYAERGDAAALVDLSDFLVVAGRKSAMLSLGNVSSGNNRLLISSFGSRGLLATMVGRGSTFTLGAQNGSSIVGWNNPVGLAEPLHQVLSAGLGVELLPSQPGALHVDLTGVKGSLLPQGGYSSGGVFAAERSSGFGGQLAASTPGQRVRFSGGVASSSYRSPFDPSLSGNLSSTPVPERAHVGRFAELSVALVKDARLWGAVPLSINAVMRDERVAPLYRSVAVSTQSDAASDGLDLTGSLDALNLQVTFTRASNNLDNVPAILKILSQSAGATASVPLAALLRVTSHGAWLPTLSYGRQQLHPYGTGLPSNSAFLPSEISDQVDVVQDASAQWQAGSWQLGYRFNQSTQDNRQPGRELADLAARSHGITVATTLGSQVDLGVALNSERHEAHEFNLLTTLQRGSLTGTWRATRLTTLDAQATLSRNGDPGAAQDTHLAELHVGFAQGIRLWHRSEDSPTAQLFVRLAQQSDRLIYLGNSAPPALAGSMWTVSSGLTLRAF